MSSGLSHILKNLKKSDSFIITPRLDAWLVASGGDLILSDKDMLFLKRALSTGYGSRVGTFTGSMAGDCHRQQIFKFLGLPQLRKLDPVLMNKFLDGTWRHIRWQIILPKAIPGTQREFRVDAPSVAFRGSLDAVHLDERWGFELKGWSNMAAVISKAPFDYHEWQAGRYWLATDEDPRVVRSITKWVYIYEDKRTQEWREIVVSRSTALEQAVLRELKTLNRHVANKELPPVLEGCRVGKGPIFQACPFSRVCRQTPDWSAAEKRAGHQVVPRPVRKRRKTASES